MTTHLDSLAPPLTGRFHFLSKLATAAFFFKAAHLNDHDDNETDLDDNIILGSTNAAVRKIDIQTSGRGRNLGEPSGQAHA